MKSHNDSPYVALVVTVPESHADQVRIAMGKAGAGRIGHYSCCSHTTTGTGRFLPNGGAQPFIGQSGEMEKVIEERIETFCEKADLEEVLGAIYGAHPYEEPVIFVFPILLPRPNQNR